MDDPYTIAGINVIIVETDEKAENHFTTLISMFVGILTRRAQGLQPPIEMTDEYRDMLKDPAVHQMVK